MELIADLLLIAAALGAAFYCSILSRRLSSLKAEEDGIGKVITTLSEQVERLEQTLDGSREQAENVERRLRATVEQANKVEAALKTALSTSSSVRNQDKERVLRPEPQPASFRRRLFSDTTAERDI